MRQLCFYWACPQGHTYAFTSMWAIQFTSCHWFPVFCWLKGGGGNMPKKAFQHICQASRRHTMHTVLLSDTDCTQNTDSCKSQAQSKITFKMTIFQVYPITLLTCCTHFGRVMGHCNRTSCSRYRIFLFPWDWSCDIFVDFSFHMVTI